jgi:hypothetical protein
VLTGNNRELEDYVAGLASARQSRMIEPNRFPEPGVWCRPDGLLMRDADWHEPSIDAVSYRPEQENAAYALKVSRADRIATWSIEASAKRSHHPT